MSKKKGSVGRRGFLKGAAGGVAALMAKPEPAPAAAPAQEGATAGRAEVAGPVRYGADFMMDVIKSLGIEYCASTPGSNFAALHESMINYGGNKNPEFLTCCHEEQSVAMAHGYAKIEGKPIMIMAQGTVGLQHASMAIYKAYADRVPVIIVLGNTLDAARRGGYTASAHSAQDVASMVRDYTKWDDTP